MNRATLLVLLGGLALTLEFVGELFVFAPGLSGTPDFGHCSNADTSASCASSSASMMTLLQRGKRALISAISRLSASKS